MSVDIDNKNFSYKVCLVGPSGVGKTSLFNTMRKTTLYSTYGTPVTTSTICPDFEKYRRVYNNLEINVDLWDTAGQERWISLPMCFFRDMRVAIMCFDITSLKSAEELTAVWDPKISDDCFKVICACKCDYFEVPKKCEAYQHILRYYRYRSVSAFFTTSSTTTQGVKELEGHMFDVLLNNSLLYKTVPNKSVNIFLPNYVPSTNVNRDRELYNKSCGGC